MEYKKIADLVRKLHEKTAGGKIAWERTDIWNEFQVSLPAYTIRLVLKRGSQGEDTYVIKIYDSRGDLLEAVNDEELAEEMPDSFTMMEETFEAARRKALGVDKAVDDIISQLDEDLPS